MEAGINSIVFPEDALAFPVITCAVNPDTVVPGDP
jgi:hypothetical protein